MRGRSYARRRSFSPRGRDGGRDERDQPTSLLVRNLRYDCRPEDLRKLFSEFGPVIDVYLPKFFYSGEPKGYGFVQYVYPADAADAKNRMDGQILHGRELTVVIAEENRKNPVDMRARDLDRGRSYYRRTSPHSSPRRSGRVHSQSRGHSPSRRRRKNSRSISPEGRRFSRERSQSISRRSHENSHSKSPARRESKSRRS